MSIKTHVNGHANGADSTAATLRSVDRRLDSTPHLTERARKAVVHGEEEAWQRGLRNVRTEHLLLGMIRETDNVAAVILRHLGIDASRVRDMIEDAIASSSTDDVPDDSAAACVDLAHDEARQLGNNYIGTEHLLLGLIREHQGLGGRIVREAGVTLAEARREVDRLQRGERGQAVMKTPSNVPFHTEVEAATRLASLLGHAHVTPMHLAVVLLSDPHETVIRLLGQFGIDPATLLAQFPEADVATRASHPTHPTLSYSAGHVLVRAVEKAHGLFHEEVAAREHLLLALLEDSEAVGTVLRASGLEPYAALLELLRLREKGV
jgi:ATP-dependent Clp protease ATP-binding subunit ClpA